MDFLPPDNQHELQRALSLEDFFDAFSQLQRLQVFKFLCQFKDGLNLQSIASANDMRPSVCSHHLTLLSRAGLVSKRTISGHAWYKVNHQLYESYVVALLYLVPKELSSLQDSSNDPNLRPETA